MLDIIKQVAKKNQIDNVQDAYIHSLNGDGTYNIKLRSGLIKKYTKNITSESYSVGDKVNISIVSGVMSDAKIIGRVNNKTYSQKTVTV